MPEQTIESDVTTETRWAVRWTPNAPLTQTGNKPPWSADYQRWFRCPGARFYRQTVTTTVTTTVSVSEWVEADDA